MNNLIMGTGCRSRHYTLDFSLEFSCCFISDLVVMYFDSYISIPSCVMSWNCTCKEAKD